MADEAQNIISELRSMGQEFVPYYLTYLKRIFFVNLIWIVSMVLIIENSMGKTALIVSIFAFMIVNTAVFAYTLRPILVRADRIRKNRKRLPS